MADSGGPPPEAPFTRVARVPLTCGAMYPRSNPKHVAAAPAAGPLGVGQPVSLPYVYGHDLREGLRLIRRLTPNSIGMNALIESSSRAYHEKMLCSVESPWRRVCGSSSPPWASPAGWRNGCMGPAAWCTTMSPSEGGSRRPWSRGSTV